MGDGLAVPPMGLALVLKRDLEVLDTPSEQLRLVSAAA